MYCIPTTGGAVSKSRVVPAPDNSNDILKLRCIFLGIRMHPKMDIPTY